jgi:opacity protein-like surface antigen
MKPNLSALFFSMIFSSTALASIYVNGGGGVTDTSIRYLELGTPEYHILGQTNGVGQLGIGVDGRWDKLYTGIEWGYEWQGFDSEQTITLTETEGSGSVSVSQFTRLNHDYYVHAKSGYVFNDMIIAYGLAGVVRGQFSFADTTGDLGTKGGLEYNTWKTGYRLGVGVSNVVKNYFEWRFEYTFNSYAPIYSTVISQNGGPANLGPEVNFKRTHINLSQVLFGIGIHF